MADAADFYPPAPPNVPPDLTAPTLAYRIRVVVVLISLLLFLVLYFGLVAGSAYLCYYSITTLLGYNEPKPPANLALFNSIQNEDTRLVNLFNHGVQQARQQRLGQQGFVELIEESLLPPWRWQRRELERLHGQSTREDELIHRFRHYFQVREESWELLVRFLRTNDDSLRDQARTKDLIANDLRQQLYAETAQMIPRPGQSSPTNFWLVALGIPAGVLCLFLVKGFLKRQQVDTSKRVEVTEKDQPILFAFIRQLCRDTGAPLPHRVYLTPEVNAAVFYNESVLSLFLPTPKNLVIGLGLVNRLNLTEFKAVLAHEFGHFSQNSMKLGVYVYTANRIVGDIVFARDWLDDLITQLGYIDLRISIFVWAFAGVLWVVRKLLQGLFHITNFAHSALSRQMEFNADLVAGSVTGSDALVHALARLEFANESLMQAWRDLTAAGDHRLFSRDLFHHQTRAADYLRGVRKDPRLGEPPVLPEDPHQTVQVFQPGEHGIPLMWATHPTNFDREQNLKSRYVRSLIDDRPAWVLFQDVATVREQVTRQFYQATRPGQEVALEDPAVVQTFIDDEHAETTYHPRYQGIFDRRFIKPGNLDGLISSVAYFSDHAHLEKAHAALYPDDLQSRVSRYHARQDEFNFLAGLVDGTLRLTGKDFPFRDARYRADDAERLLKQVRQELAEDDKWLGEWDRQFVLVHYEIARQVSNDVRAELADRYRFHLALQDLLNELSAQNQQVHILLNQLAGYREIAQEWFQHAINVLQRAHETLCHQLHKAESLRLPRLKNMTPGEPLSEFLTPRPLLHRLSGTESALDGQWIQAFLAQLAEVIDKSQRIHFKSLGGILALQEGVAEQWANLRTPVV
jgi:Zn-dependent protease with chaperone function